MLREKTVKGKKENAEEEAYSIERCSRTQERETALQR